MTRSEIEVDAAYSVPPADTLLTLRSPFPGISVSAWLNSEQTQELIAKLLQAQHDRAEHERRRIESNRIESNPAGGSA